MLESIIIIFLFLYLVSYLKERFDPDPIQQTVGGGGQVSPRDFEYQCAKWMNQKGYDCEMTSYSGDGNVDFYIYQDKQLIGIAECKYWNKPVGAGPVKTLYATMLQCGVNRAWFFSQNGYSLAAIDYVESLRAQINLIEGREIG